MITDYIGGEGSAETPKNDYVIYGWPLMTKWLFKTETVQSLRIICLVSLVSDDQWSPYSTDVQTDQLTSTILTRSMSLFAHPDELHWDVIHQESVAIESNVVLRCWCRSAYLVRPVPPHPSSYSALCPPPLHPQPPNTSTHQTQPPTTKNFILFL